MVLSRRRAVHLIMPSLRPSFMAGLRSGLRSAETRAAKGVAGIYALSPPACQPSLGRFHHSGLAAPYQPRSVRCPCPLGAAGPSAGSAPLMTEVPAPRSGGLE